MEDKASFKKHIRFAFRIVHIDNIPHVVKYGLVHNDSPFASDSFVPIGDVSVMDARSTKQLTDGSFLSEYIPFYFGPRSPMLYNIQNGNGILTKKEPDEIVYCVIRIEDVINSDLHCVFTDGHALNNMSKFYSKSDLQRLDSLVKMEDVYATYWFNQSPWDDRKRKKEAELLFKDEIPPQFIVGFLVYNKKAFEKMISFGIPKEKIIVKPEYYY